MALKKKIKKQLKKSKKQEFVFKNTDFWIGLTIFTLLTIAALTLAFRSIATCKIQPNPRVKSSKVLNPSISPTKTKEDTKKQPRTEKILQNDSYWNISTRACGDGKFYLAIQNLNGGRELSPGQSVSVVCSTD